MTRSKVIDRLVTFGPPVIARWARTRARCILATAIGLDVLAAFEIAAEPWPVALTLANGIYLARIAAGEHPAMAVTRGGHVMQTADQEEYDRRLGQWSGHLVIHVPAAEALIDLDLQQLARPERGIVLPAAVVLAWPAGTRRREYALPGGGQLAVLATGDRTFTGGRDWTDAAKRAPLVEQVVRAIRAGHL